MEQKKFKSTQSLTAVLENLSKILPKKTQQINTILAVIHFEQSLQKKGNCGAEIEEYIQKELSDLSKIAGKISDRVLKAEVLFQVLDKQEAELPPPNYSPPDEPSPLEKQIENHKSNLHSLLKEISATVEDLYKRLTESQGYINQQLASSKNVSLRVS